MKTVLTLTLLSFLACGKSRELSVTTSLDDIFRPTTLFSGRRDGNDQPSTPLNLFQEKSLHKKNRGDIIWKWDYWCQLQPHKGNCSKIRDRFYYDTRFDKCVKFKYSGCGGNNNRFDSIVECMRHCKGAAFTEPELTDISSSCALQPNAGLCMAIFNRFYYDVNVGDCKSFVYGGCGGNGNRFHTKYKCRKKCENHAYEDN